MAGLFAILLAYSQTWAFAWDEGYHVLAAQLIAHGKRPYLDFFFPQMPLNAYWNAAGLRLFGETWREVHALSAVVTTGTILLAAEFVYRHFPAPEWRLPGAIAAAGLIGFQANYIRYTTTGQPYALCLFLVVAAFRVSVAAAKREDWIVTAAAGLLASAAAGCSLLVSAAPVILLVWIVWQGAKDRRVARFGAFVAGAAVPLLPVAWFLGRAPRQVFFNLFEYHLFYRRANWEDATPHDWEVLTSWMTSPNTIALALLAAAGLWVYRRRPEFALCGWLSLGIGAELCSTHPTFEWYYAMLIPFLAIPGAAGLYAIASRLWPKASAWQLPALVLLVVALASAKTLYDDRAAFSWRFLETVAYKVDEVTPPGAAVWGDEHIHFLTRRPPAEGTEVSYAEIIDLPEPLAASLHVVPLDTLDRHAAEGRFATVETCEEKEQIDDLDLPRLFVNSTAVGSCHVFWGPAGAAKK